MNYIQNQKSPFFRHTPDDLRRMLADDPSPQNLADIFAAVSNQYWELVCASDDTPADVWTLWVLDNWENLYNELIEQIRSICGDSGSPGTGYNPMLTAFMVQYGYQDGGPLWIKTES